MLFVLIQLENGKNLPPESRKNHGFDLWGLVERIVRYISMAEEKEIRAAQTPLTEEELTKAALGTLETVYIRAKF